MTNIPWIGCFMGNVNKMKEKWANKEAKVWFMEAQKWTQHMVSL
jgi:hypothetical protein